VVEVDRTFKVIPWGDIAISSAGVLAILVFADWGFPSQLRNAAVGQFRRDYNDFYSSYGAGRKLRLSIALVIAIATGLVATFGDQLALMFAIILGISGYTLLIGYYMWCAETGRKPWS
jgi:hypothetical protein